MMKYLLSQPGKHTRSGKVFRFGKTFPDRVMFTYKTEADFTKAMCKTVHVPTFKGLNVNLRQANDRGMAR